MKNKCKNCYVEIKEYTYLRGIFFCLMLTIMFMIPILNLLFLTQIVRDELDPKHFWKDYWYDLKQVKVLKGG